MDVRPSVTTILFTDIEGSTRLWEQEPERMREALARHDALGRAAVETHHGTVVKTTGDGLHAVFPDPLDAVRAVLTFQQSLADAQATAGVELRVRCGIHAGVIERRDNDYFGSAVNRAARIMAVAHGGQALVSQAVVELVGGRLPAGVELRDLGSVRLRDLSGSERVYQLVHPSLRGEFPALRSLESTPNNLPQQLTTFVGREREIAEARSLLRRNRLLTLFGTGGLGKTRLSLQLAGEVLGDFPDGVWFVELAPVADPRLVPQAVASVLGVKEDAGHPVLEALLRFVRDRKLLVVLDNCEHLVDACAELATQLLQSGAKVKIVATSREALRVAAEANYPVPALVVPAAGQTGEPSSLAQFEAVRLFVDRAMAVQPAFRLTDRNAGPVAEICRRLDGIPLAIELAAARLRALSVDAIAAKLGDVFRLLTGGDRTAMPRQQTLRALIDWSHDLLTANERALLRRVAAFAGGWTIEAAEMVCAGGEVVRADVLDLLTGLVDKSLVVLDAEAGRYRLLETVRQYAEEKLAESGEGDATRQRHVEFFLAFAESARAQLAGALRADTLLRLDQDRENLLAAHLWSMQPHLPASAAYRFVHALKHYWFSRGLLNLGYRLAVDALSRGNSGPAAAGRAEALFDAGQMAGFMGRYDDAQRYLGESLALARELGDEALAASLLQPLSLAALGRGDRDAARQYGREGLDLARRIGNRTEIAGACNALAQVHRLEGNLDAAEPLYEEMLALSREAGHSENIAVGLLNLAMVAVERGSPERARALLLEVLSIAQRTGSKPAGLSALEVSAGLAALSRDWDRAARLYGVAESQTREIGIQRDPADDAFLQPWIAATRDAAGPSRFAETVAAGARTGYAAAIAETGAWLAGP